jgi:hypothetical protein
LLTQLRSSKPNLHHLSRHSPSSILVFTVPSGVRVRAEISRGLFSSEKGHTDHILLILRKRKEVLIRKASLIAAR